MNLRLTLLGSGTSHGIPMIACDCPVCTSPDPRDRRTRTSALFQADDFALLIDTPPELRLQCVTNRVLRVDAVAYTHHHADHVTGLDDLRRFCTLSGKPLPVYGQRATLDYLRMMFPYAFVDDPNYVSEKPTLIATPIDPEPNPDGKPRSEAVVNAGSAPGTNHPRSTTAHATEPASAGQLQAGPIEVPPFQSGPLTVTPLPYLHGKLPVFGYRVGDIAYCPDVSRIPDQTRPLLEGLDILILDGLRRRPHPTHFNLEQAIAEAERIGANQTYFTHIAHELPHAATNAELPPGMQLAYDGLVLESNSSP